MIVQGLRDCGYEDIAAELAHLTLDAIRKWYEKEGVLFEFYDCDNVISPRELDRKRYKQTGRGFGSISDYGWTAALTVDLIAGMDLV